MYDNIMFRDWGEYRSILHSLEESNKISLEQLSWAIFLFAADVLRRKKAIKA